MNCDEVRELLAAFALDALTEDERAAVAEHLEGCALHPELADLRATIEALPALADPLDPPTALRQRVLAIASAPAEAPRASDPTPLPPRPRGIPRVPWAIAAVVAAFAIALGWWTSTTQVSAPVLITRAATASAGPSQGRITYAPQTNQLTFEVDTLPAAPAGMTYQLWVVRGATPVSLGLFNPTPAGHGQLTVETTLTEGEVIAVTVEPIGGSPAPTTAPFLAIEI